MSASSLPCTQTVRRSQLISSRHSLSSRSRSAAGQSSDVRGMCRLIMRENGLAEIMKVCKIDRLRHGTILRDLRESHRCRFWSKAFFSFASNSLENVHIEFVTDHRSSAFKRNCDPDHIFAEIKRVGFFDSLAAPTKGGECCTSSRSLRLVLG